MVCSDGCVNIVNIKLKNIEILYRGVQTGYGFGSDPFQVQKKWLLGSGSAFAPLIIITLSAIGTNCYRVSW